MSNPGSRVFDELGRLMTDAAGVAEGMRREVEGLVKTQGERFLADMDLVKREEFEVLRELVQRLAEDNEALKARVAAIEARAADATARSMAQSLQGGT
jgi:BMFP domain-containing protein YqiC